MPWSVSPLICQNFPHESIINATSIALAVSAQQQYEFVTKWGSEGSGPGQFNGQNDVDPFMVRICCRL
jgi:hypothetical protein